jgi:hypothetical protein
MPTMLYERWWRIEHVVWGAWWVRAWEEQEAAKYFLEWVDNPTWDGRVVKNFHDIPEGIGWIKSNN